MDFSDVDGCRAESLFLFQTEEVLLRGSTYATRLQQSSSPALETRAAAYQGVFFSTETGCSGAGRGVVSREEQIAGFQARRMADLVVGIALSAAQTLYESLGVPGARTPGQVASWTKDEEDVDIPELALNWTLLVETFLQLFASGLGTLAFVWATVVLLGGFSSMLTGTDFWFITAIVFVETARIVGHNSGHEAKFFVELPAAAAAFSQTNNILGRLSLVPNWIAQAPIVAAIAFITLSIIRLVGISRGHSSNSTLKPALMLFYALVLTQGALFFVWFYVAMNRWVLAKTLKDYFENAEVVKLEDGIKLMDRYVTSTLDTCIEKGVVSTLNRTLVSFAAELLQSENNGDHAYAVSVLYVVITRKERTVGVVHQICASEKLAGRLFQLIRTLNQDAKAYAADILAKLACNLRLADIPEAVPSISSLLDGRLMETAALPGENRIVTDTDDSGPIGKPLFVHGLLILGELAGDTENRTEICQAPDLVSKIVAPVSHGLPKFSVGDDSKTIQIVKASLVLMARLTSGKGETSTKMCSKISKDESIAENLLWILQKSNGDHEMGILALEILTRLSLGDATGGFIGMLGDLLSHVQDSPLKMPAVRALSALAADHGTCQLIIWKQGRLGSSLIQQLVDVMRNDANSEFRTVTAELLAQICANSAPDQDSRDRLKPVSSSLSTAIIVETTNYADYILNGLQQVPRPDGTTIHAKCYRIFILSFLSLVLEICDKLVGVNAEAVTNMLATLQMDDRALARTLMEIVCLASQTHEDAADFARLKIMQITTKLAIWLMNTNRSYIRYFQQEGIIEKLQCGGRAMRDLERDMILTALTTHETKDYEPLQSLVGKVTIFFGPQQN